jgi:hypothetical protein
MVLTQSPSPAGQIATFLWVVGEVVELEPGAVLLLDAVELPGPVEPCRLNSRQEIAAKL